ncbi:hypothetical protein [Marinobacter sp. MBR-105]
MSEKWSMHLKWQMNRLHKAILCPLGKHDDTHLNGEKSNFCGACGKQMNPYAFKDFEVHLVGGEVKRVKAVSAQDAASRVIFEGKEYRFDIRSGEPIGEFTVHPENIVRVKEAEI